MTGETASGTRPARAGDGSLRREDQTPRPLLPDSLVWKYFGDRRIQLLVGRAGVTENMYPQLGQGVSDHSVIFTSLRERVKRSIPPIYNAVYGTEPEKVGIRIRNFHKPINGTMSDQSAYHGTPYRGLDPETFYWAHATFLDMIYAMTERFVRPLSLAEKEQIFQESRDWYSLYGMDPSPQPETYLEFKQYWDRTVREELVGHTRVAQYTVGYISKGITRVFPRPGAIPEPLWTNAFAPMINTFAAFLGAGALDPVMREKLDIPWTPAQARRYSAFCAIVRWGGVAWERFAPLHWRYVKEAVDGFEREGIDPRKIRVRRGPRE